MKTRVMSGTSMATPTVGCPIATHKTLRCLRHKGHNLPRALGAQPHTVPCRAAEGTVGALIEDPAHP